MRSSPTQYLETLRPTTYSDVFQSSVPTLAAVAHIGPKGEAVARALLVKLISQTVRFFSLREAMDEMQIATTADLILEDYFFLKLDDLKLCFRNAMKGYYGRIYNRMDGQTILLWLRQYTEERHAAAEAEALSEHARRKREEADAPSAGLTREEYMARMEEAARLGDRQALHALQAARSLEEQLRRMDSRDPGPAGRIMAERRRRQHNAEQRELKKKALQAAYAPAAMAGKNH